MRKLQINTKEMQKKILRFYYDYGEIILLGLGLQGAVIASYALSRLIPEEIFEHIICPIFNGLTFIVSVVGAVLVHRHTYRIRARRKWMWALIWWAILGAVLVVFQKTAGVTTLGFGGHIIEPYGLVICNVFALLLLAYPFEVLYPKWLNWWRSALLVLPAFLIWGIDELTDIDMRILLIIWPLIITGYLMSQIRVYRLKCEENYSTLENSAMKWIDIYLIIVVIIGLSYFYLCFSNHPTRAFTQQWLILGLLVYNTLQIVLRERPWQETPQEEGEEEKATSTESEAHSEEFRQKLEAWMETEKPYLNKDFRLVQLMEVLPLNRTYLSNFINMEYGCSFYQFVTNYRIEEAKRLMKECPELKLQDVADQSGFSSATVFGRIFRRETGCTPTDWIEQNR